MRPPARVREMGTLPTQWHVVVLAAGWHGGMGIPPPAYSCRLDVDKLGGATKMGEPPKGNKVSNPENHMFDMSGVSTSDGLLRQAGGVHL
jgi:hypothetical protein